MYLSKIELSMTHSGVRVALRDAQKMHRLVSGLYGVRRADAAVLYRVRTRGSTLTLYLYANCPIDQGKLLSGMILAGERDVSDWLSGFADGQVWHFDLLTMPSKKVAEPDGQNSRRRVLRTQEERLAWLSRKAEQNSFSVLEAQETQYEKLSAVHATEQGGTLYMDAYRYTGTLLIHDAETFRHAVQRGIGPGKAYGLGMLLLKR